MLASLSHRLHARSAALLVSVECGLPRMITLWLILALSGSALRLMFSPRSGLLPDLPTLFPYILLTCAPLLSLALALKWFEHGDMLAQPVFRLARGGRWRRVDRSEAMRHPLYGSSGIMVSLLIGTLLNVPIRAAEYFAALPAIGMIAPPWLARLHVMMTLDVVLLSSLYTIAFTAALRRVPLFPRLLVAIWGIDLVMQISIAKVVTAAGDLPASVGLSLQTLLDGNVKKVLISAALWTPYLIMSQRVNVTFRKRVRA